MPSISATSTPANRPRLTGLLNGYAATLNGLGRYSASVAGSRLDLTPLFAPVHFVRVSPAAYLGAVTDFCTFVAQNPPARMVDDYARHAGDVGNPTPRFTTDLTTRLADPNRTFPDKLEVLQNALAQIHQRSLPEIFENVILPWFFSVYPAGRVLAVTQTAEGSSYEFMLRNLIALARYGLEAVEADAQRRKPYMDLLQPLDARIENIAKLCLQYNGPFIDGFCLRGIFSVFIFIPSESVHRRSFQNVSMFDILAPYSSVGAAGDLHVEDGHQDTIRALHPKRNAREIEEWVRYWLDRADATLDRLFNLCRADDGNGNIELDEYLRGILQFERIFFEITWSCSMLDQFLRKVVTYAVIDKVTAFMSNNWGANGTAKFVNFFTAAFMVTRLSQLFQNPRLQADAHAWLQAIHNNMVATQRRHTYPSNLIQGGNVDWAGRGTHLAQCAALPGSAPVVTEEVYIGQLIRAIRNTHHGFADLYDRPFAVLSSSSGVVSDELPAVLPFLAFAMLDNPDVALSHSW
jgi:hypothetical protein